MNIVKMINRFQLLCLMLTVPPSGHHYEIKVGVRGLRERGKHLFIYTERCDWSEHMNMPCPQIYSEF